MKSSLKYIRMELLQIPLFEQWALCVKEVLESLEDEARGCRSYQRVHAKT